MVELSIQLLQFLGVLIPVMFASIRFVHEKDTSNPFENTLAVHERTNDNCVTNQILVPYSSILLGVTFVLLMGSLLLLVANIGYYAYSGQTLNRVFAVAVGVMLVGLVSLSAFILYSLPRIEMSYV